MNMISSILSNPGLKGRVQMWIEMMNVGTQASLAVWRILLVLTRFTGGSKRIVVALKGFKVRYRFNI